MEKRISIIGGGISGLATAAILAKAGHKVTLFEKNASLGGRAIVFKEKGFTFDMGPSWYLMPEVFERFFALFDKQVTDFYQLTKLNPSYRVYFSPNDSIDILTDKQKNLDNFELREPGSAKKIGNYIDDAKHFYDLAIKHFLYTSFTHPRDILRPKFLLYPMTLKLFQSLDTYINTITKNPQLRQILEYSSIFLGSSPKKLPAIFSLMSHIDYNQGVFYPQGGFGTVINAIIQLCKKYEVSIQTSTSVDSIEIIKGQATGVMANKKRFAADIVISAADMAFTETKLLDPKYQSYPLSYWQKKVIAPSAFILYLGIKGRIKYALHHTLVFSGDWDQHVRQVFDRPEWPSELSYYMCMPSITDHTVAPAGYENLFVLLPIASGLTDTPQIRKNMRDRLITHIENTLGQKISDRIVFEKTLSLNDYSQMYNAYRGNALGLAHTLTQSAMFRPKNKSSKVSNLYYTGQYTIPGIGMPMCLISAQIVAERIQKEQI